MSDRAPYSRVYWSIIDDPKFTEVYDSDRALACWLRLLIAADAIWPAPASIPATSSKTSVALLVRVGLIDLQPGGRYRIHGLDSERGIRRLAATRLRLGQDPTGTQQGPNRTPDAFTIPGRSRAEPSRAEPSRAEPSRAELSQAEPTGSAYPEGDSDCLDTYHDLTLYRPWGQFSGDKLKGAITEYGDAVVDAALRAEHATDADRKTLLDRTLARLARDADRAKEAKRSKPKSNGHNPEQDAEILNLRKRLAAGEVV